MRYRHYWSKFDRFPRVAERKHMHLPNPLLRTFVEKATEKSFDKGLLWGIFAGAMVTHFYKEDQYKKLQTKYYTLKETFLNYQITEQKHGRAGVRLDAVNE